MLSLLLGRHGIYLPTAEACRRDKLAASAKKLATIRLIKVRFAPLTIGSAVEGETPGVEMPSEIFEE